MYDTHLSYLEKRANLSDSIMSGNSDAAVLVDQETDGGLRNYWLYVLTCATRTTVVHILLVPLITRVNV